MSHPRKITIAIIQFLSLMGKGIGIFIIRISKIIIGKRIPGRRK